MEEMVELPVNEEIAPVRPAHSMVSDSMYAASLSGGDVTTNFRESRYAFDTTGQSPLVEQAQARWKQEQDVGNREAVSAILTDTSLDNTTKQSVLAEYARTGFVASGLKEKYKLKIAAKDLSVSKADRDAQDVYIETMAQRDSVALEAQGAVDKFEASLDDNKTMALLGILRDVIPGVNLSWNYSVAKAARAVGVDKTGWDSVKSFFFSGSANSQIKDAYDALPIEKRKEFVTRLVETYKDSPSFDFNKWIDFTSQTEADHPAWAVGLENAASVLNVVGLGWLFKGMAKPSLTPSVHPASPAGVTANANPKVAQKLGVAALVDNSGELAAAAGTTRGALIADWMLPKIDPSVAGVYPDLATELASADRKMSDVFRGSKFDPSLINYTEKDLDMAYVGQVLKEVKGPTYQQANSVVEEESRLLKGTLTFGRDDVSGFTNKKDADKAVKQLQEAISNVSGGTPGTVRTVKHGKQHFVMWDFEKETDPFSHLVFGTDSVSASIGLPWFNGKEFKIRADALARSSLGSWIFPSTMRMDPWVPKSAALADLRASKIEHDFLTTLQGKVATNPHKQELYVALQESEVAGAWKSPQELSAMFPHIGKQGQEQLYSAYAFYRRIGDYEYNWANRWDRAQKASKEYGAIYNREGTLVGYGTERTAMTERPKLVWDTSLDRPVPFTEELNGRKLVRLETPRTSGKASFEFAIVDSLQPLPPHTLPKLEVYIPRRNMESWYVKSTPRELELNGIKVSDKARLEQHQRVIGAGDTRADAEALAARMREDYPDMDIAVKQDRLDSPDAILTDYRVYKDSLDYGKKRGDRLPTLTGSARLEDPLVAMTRAIKTTVRLDAWKDYTDAFKTNWMKAFGEFVNGHDFPSVKTDLRPPKGATPETLAKFRTAERLFEQYTNQAYKSTIGDELWKNFFFTISDELEKLPFQLPHQLAKDMARQGNLVVKIPKMLGTKLFIDTNVLRQYFVQPQQLLEIAAGDADIAKHIGLNVSQVSGAVIARAKMLEGVHDPMHKALRAASGMDAAKFDATVEAIYSSGLPQSIDLNMMLHGMFNDVDRALVESTGRKFWEGTKSTVNLPFKVGRSVGYSTAELGNQIGMWLASQERWIKAHPGANWNTPNNIAKITGDAWDIAHSMSTRAGAFPYQDGALSLPFQFVAVQHKAFMQTFSSKTLTAQERANIGAARMALYGMYGVPAGLAIDMFIQKYAGEDTKKEWDGWKRGLSDWAVNNVLRALVDGPDEKSNIAISSALSPLPETLPYFDLLRELMKYGEDGKGNLRLPFVNSTSSVYKGVSDMWNVFRTGVLDTPQALDRAGRIAMETMSGYNNYAKAMMLKNYGDKMDKMGNQLGLGATHAEMYAQFFGITTEREVAYYAARDQMKQREDFVKKYSEDVHRQLMGMRTQFGKEDFQTYVDRMKSLTSLLDPSIQDAVRESVMKLDRQSLLTKNESILMYIIEHHKQGNDRYVSSMIAHLTSSDNPQAQRNIEALKKEGIYNGQ